MLDEAIASIEGATTIAGLKGAMQKAIERYGFASFNFIDAGKAYEEVPLYFGTTGERWESDYRGNNFVSIDPYIAKARRWNVPFDWKSIPLPPSRRGPKTGVMRLMDAAWSHGYREGLVVPYHFRDEVGRSHSTVCVFYWKDKVAEFERLLGLQRHQMHLLVIYFMQRSIELLAAEKRRDVAMAAALERARNGEGPRLTDRERDVLSWAGRGKTSAETADILKLSELTVDTHVRNAIAKLDARNKTQAVAKCVWMGLIDL
ncbi:MAG: LuxR C-terminal-related transcriptional regulator [Hyphomonas sp.]|nr:LuxR C-terminal-related transcriptional regulator [Hyphomonas sp.]